MQECSPLPQRNVNAVRPSVTRRRDLTPTQATCESVAYYLVTTWLLLRYFLVTTSLLPSTSMLVCLGLLWCSRLHREAFVLPNWDEPAEKVSGMCGQPDLGAVRVRRAGNQDANPSAVRLTAC
jgi:hypothetical protein